MTHEDRCNLEMEIVDMQIDMMDDDQWREVLSKALRVPLQQLTDEQLKRKLSQLNTTWHEQYPVPQK